MNDPVEPVGLRYLARWQREREEMRAWVGFVALVAFIVGLLLG